MIELILEGETWQAEYFRSGQVFPGTAIACEKAGWWAHNVRHGWENAHRLPGRPSPERPEIVLDR